MLQGMLCRLPVYSPILMLIIMPRFYALSWNTPQSVDPAYRSHLREKYTKDLTLLHTALPGRFQPIIQKCIDFVDRILSLPMVLLHKDLGDCNIMVDGESCHLVGVIDWAEAEVCPFGLNLHSIQPLTGEMHLRNGWSRYDDYTELQNIFWSTFQEEVGDLSDDTLQTIKQARIVGLLRSRGFTSRLANEPEPMPICDDQKGRYNMMYLDAFLINEATKFD